MVESEYWKVKSEKKKLKRFKKGSEEAKRYMSRIRRIRTGKVKERKRTYYDGLYTRRRRK